MDLFNHERHETLKKIPWNFQHLEDYSQYILTQTVKNYSAQNYWPVHPLDVDSEVLPLKGFNDFYFGAGGLFWLLDNLKFQSSLNSTNEYLRFLSNLTIDKNENFSIFFDQIGFLLFKEKLVASQQNRDELHHIIEKLPGNDKNEILYGIPSTLLVAFHAYKLTGEDRFFRLSHKLKDNMLSKWNFDHDRECFLWTQHFQTSRQFIGAAHGTFGNLHVLFKVSELLSPKELTLIEERASVAFQKLACSTEKHANWPILADPSSGFLLHWCHGSPGAICALADFLPRNKVNDDLLLKGGELIWDAGPLKKGTSLCHGTSGNAIAFLKLFNRTQDEKWLERAQAFSMHCLKQCELMEKQYGRLRFSLWTGDLGLVWLHQQIKNQTANLPILDIYL